VLPAQVGAWSDGEEALAGRWYPRLCRHQLLTAGRNFYSFDAWACRVAYRGGAAVAGPDPARRTAGLYHAAGDLVTGAAANGVSRLRPARSTQRVPTLTAGTSTPAVPTPRRISAGNTSRHCPPAAKHFTLNNGVEMRGVGFGVFQTPPDETRSAVGAAGADHGPGRNGGCRRRYWTARDS
jgi:hypothetical protein